MSEDDLEAELSASPQSQVSFNVQDEKLVEDELDGEEYDIEEDEVFEDEIDVEEKVEGSGIKEKFNSLVAKIKKSAASGKKPGPKAAKEKTGLHKVEKTVKTFVDKKLPGLANILKKKKSTKVEKIEEIDTSNIELDGVKPKRKIEVKKGIIYGLAAIGLIVVFLVEDPPPPSEFESKTAKTKKTPPKRPTKIAPKETAEPVVKEPVVAEPVEEEPVVEEPIEVVQDDTQKPDVADEATTDLDKEIDEKINQITKNQNMDLDELKNTKVEEPKVNDSTQVTDGPVADDNINMDMNNSTATVTNEDLADDQLSDLDMDQLNQTENTAEPDPQTANNDASNNLNDFDSQTGSNAEEVSIDDSNDVLMDEEIIPQPDIQPDISSEITKKLLEDLEVKLKDEQKAQKTLAVTKPTDPPSYDALGMGLVYNCKGSHWACVEQGSYKTCRENYSWNKNEGIPLECYPVAFLENEYDCALLQQEKIDSVAETNFCR